MVNIDMLQIYDKLLDKLRSMLGIAGMLLGDCIWGQAVGGLGTSCWGDWGQAVGGLGTSCWGDWGQAVGGLGTSCVTCTVQQIRI